MILLYQSSVVVFPTAGGLGQMIYGSLKERKDMVASGGRSVLIGAALFVVGAFHFELIVGISALGIGLGRFGWPLGLVILGIVLLVGGLVYRRRSKPLP
jgi:uncharacterized membrane protein